jgi:uncharacterized protein (TIGR02246 family)
METQLRRSGWLTLGAVLLASLAWAQNRGTSEDEPAIKALVESQNRVLVQGVGNLADVFAADTDWTNAWGKRLHDLEELSRFWEQLRHDQNYLAGKVTPESVKTDVRFVRPDVAVIHTYAERVGQIDSTTGKVIPTRKVHSQIVVSKEDGKWLIQSELIMDEKQHEGPSQQIAEEAAVRKLSELQFHQGHDLTCLAGAHETGDSKQGAAVSLVKFDPGCIIPWHWHTPNENVMVVDGALLQEWKDHPSSVAKRGDFVHIPSHQVNQATCVSDAPCMILLYSDGPWDMHYVDASGKEISGDEAVAAATKKR